LSPWAEGSAHDRKKTQKPIALDTDTPIRDVAVRIVKVTRAADWDARQWLIDNDLWDDSVGMPSEMYDRQPDTPRPDADAHRYRISITDTELLYWLVT
jgi:hypothetical protein